MPIDWKVMDELLANVTFDDKEPEYKYTFDGQGIVEVQYVCDDVNGDGVYVDRAGRYYLNRYESVVDNMERLFDLIVDYKEDRCRLYYTYDVKDFGIMRRLHHDDKNATYYGAIWTKDGLIYVAKLDENGEWQIYDRIRELYINDKSR